VKSPLRRILAYPFVTAYFVVSLFQAPLVLLALLFTHTAALIQTGDIDGAFVPVWMMFVLEKIQVVNKVRTIRSAPFPIVMAHIYCESQGPSTGAQDHLIGYAKALPPLHDIVEVGDADAHGGRRVSYDNQIVVCPKCGAPLRRFELK